MPFTLTHTLAVLPIAQQRSPLPVTALLIGAMVPDWSLFVPFGPHYTTTHMVEGLVLACLPLGFGLYLLFHALYRRALIELMPQSIQSRLMGYRHWQCSFSAKELGWAAVGVLIGAGTHLLWDTFTHTGRWGVELLPVLDQSWISIGSTKIQGYKLIQHGSSLVGLPLLAFLSWRWLHRQAEVDPRPTLITARTRLLIWSMLIVLPCLAALGKVWRLLDDPFTTYWLHRTLFHCVTQFGLWFLVLLTVYSLVLRCMSAERMRLDVFPGLPN